MIKIPENYYIDTKTPFKVLLISGGHGSNDFIKKIWDKDIHKKTIQIRTLFNPFDDGASCGIVRDTLGVSGLGDGRKNQYNMFKQLYGDKIPDYVKQVYDLLFDVRHSFEDSTVFAEEFKNRILKIVNDNKEYHNTDYNFTTEGIKVLNIILDSIITFSNKFWKNKSGNSFNVSNIFYGIMEYYSTSSIQDILNSISTSVFCLNKNGVMTSLNDSARLKSITNSGTKLDKETPDVIKFSKMFDGSDNIKSQYIAPYKRDKSEKLNMWIDKSTSDYIINSNIILVCPGTVFSSINPTLLNDNIYSLINTKSNAKKFIYLNDDADLDYNIQNTSGNILENRYEYYRQNAFRNLGDFIALHKDQNMSNAYDDIKYVDYDNFLYSIMCYYFFDEYVEPDKIKNKKHIFDYDGTLYSASEKELSDYIIPIIDKLIEKNNCYITTGNYELRYHTNKLTNTNNVFMSNVYNADYSCIDYCKGLNLNKELTSEDNFKELENKYTIFDFLKSDRLNDIITTIKHVDTNLRHIISSNINKELDESDENKNLKTYCFGKTSIDYIFDDYLKKNLTQVIDVNNSIYIGDGVNNPFSNDYEISQKCDMRINVNSLIETLIFLTI